MLGMIMWVVPAHGEAVRKVAMLLGGAAILGGIIGWLSFEGEDLLEGELVGPGF